MRFFSNLIEEIKKIKIKNLVLELDLQHLSQANSELLAQFVIMQSELVKLDGRLRIINANHDLRGPFDVVMLNKVIEIAYANKKINSEK